MKKKILSILFALVLAVSLLLVPAAPVAVAANPDFVATLVRHGDASAGWSIEKAYTGDYSVKLYAADFWVDDTAAVGIPVGDIPFDQITELSYWKYILSFDYVEGEQWGFNPLVILGIDANGDGVLDFDIEDAMLYSNEANPQLGDDAILVIESTTGEAPYLTEPDTDWGEVDALVGDPENLDYPLVIIGFDNTGYLDEVYHWADFVGFGPIDTTDNVKLVVLALDCPSNQTVYVDDVTINGVLYNLEPRVVNTDTTQGFNTIQSAIDAANPRDTILVHPGTYLRKIVINKALTVKSTDGAEDTIIQGVSTSDYYLVDIQHSDVTFDGFTVTNPTTAFESDVSGILVQSRGELVSNVHILDNIVTQVRSETGTASRFAATGINIGTGPLSNIVISGNTIKDIKNPGEKTESSGFDHTCGINIWNGAEDVEISNNTISDIKYNGIILECASDVLIENNPITECQSGIRLEPREGDISNIQIEENSITGCKYGISVVPEAHFLSGLTVNFNNIFGNREFGVLNATVDSIDATKNWWGDASGPEHATLNPGAQGDAVSDNVDFSPWLYKTQEQFVSGAPCYAGSVVLGNVATEVTVGEVTSYAGGWNTFSTPIYLDGDADTWAKLYGLTGLDYALAYRFDLATQKFEKLTTTNEYPINPGEGFFIKMKSAGSLPILCSTEEKLMPPSRALAKDWNLIGLASMKRMPVEAALSSIVTAPGLAGYGPVVSPIGNVSPGAVLADGMLHVGEGYWVYMLGARTLAGFTMTPVSWMR